MSRYTDRLHKRDLAHRARQEEALRDAGFTANGSRSLREAMEARQREQRRPRHNASLQFLWLFAALGAQTLLWGSVAVGERLGTAAALCVTVACGWHWWSRRGLIERRTWAAAGVAVLLVGALGLVGVVSQTVTEQGPLRIGSPQERTLEQAAMLERDLQRIQYWGDLALLSEDEAKVRSAEIRSAVDAAVLLAGASDESWTTPELGEVARRIRAAAGFSHDALTLRFDTALQPDQAKLDAIPALVAAADEQAQQAATLNSTVVQSVRGGSE